MNNLRLTALLGFAAVLAACVAGEERNAWPVLVRQYTSASVTESWQAIGPLLFEKPAADGGVVSGFRPFYVQTNDAKGLTAESTVLYPLFLYRTNGEVFNWSILDLINRSGSKAGAPLVAAQKQETFDVWPLWFSRQTNSPETTYQALFPIAGTIKHRFGDDRLSWMLWPLFMTSEKQGTMTTFTPWPIIRTTHGVEQGFALWPLFGWSGKIGVFDRRYFLWPLIWKNTIQPPTDAPAGTPPTHQVGFLPFYSRDQRAGFLDVNFGWPFFGYTTRTTPYHYHETRYLWPFLVQGHGDNRDINRWGPFYTHSSIKGMDKTWVLWPLLREARWTDADITQTKIQLLYFLYWSLEQRSAANPALPSASKTHLWPLFSAWDNGAGRHQLQAPSPLEVFFPGNDRVRQTWTPLFALYRYDQRSTDTVSHSLLWGAVTWQREVDRHEFHLGPIFSVDSHSRQKRFSLANGLLGLEHRPDAGGWRLFWFDFPSNLGHAQTSSR